MSAATTSEDARKTLATLQARAALLGVALVPSTDDHDRPVFVATWRGATRQLGSAGEVEVLLGILGRSAGAAA